MQTTIQRSELYTDKGHYAVMTRTTVLKYAKLARIADHLCRNADKLASSTNPPTIDNCRIAGAMLGWAHNLTPLRIGTRFDY
jgi:hypothetical protein